MTTKRPAFQFYPADWRKDLALRKCSLAARGMWVELMCIAHECEPYGTLRHNGEPLQADDIAGLVGMCSPREAKALISELVRKGVAKVDDDGVLYSKRMVHDEAVRNARAEGGKAGAEHGSKGAEHGSKGGRPSASKGGDKGGYETPLSGEQKPPPSSSSSSSASAEEQSNLTVAPPRPAADGPQLALIEGGPKPTEGPPDCPHLQVLALWAEKLPALPQHKPAQWKGARADHLRARWREQAVQRQWKSQADGVEWFSRLFAYIGQSKFLTGQVPSRDAGKPPFVAELEWIVMPGNFAKLVEGKYHRSAA